MPCRALPNLGQAGSGSSMAYHICLVGVRCSLHVPTNFPAKPKSHALHIQQCFLKQA